MNYWEQRQQQLNRELEKDEARLKKRLSSYYDEEYRKLQKEISAYFQEYGADNIIEYRVLMQSLPEADKRLLIERMDEFAKKYPEYAHLMPVRESIYKLNRLEGLQMSVRMQQYEMGAITNKELTEHLNRQALRGANAAAEAMGFGKNFYSGNPDIAKRFVNIPWARGENFSERRIENGRLKGIWSNAEKLANYLNTDIAQGFARGDSYDRLVRKLRQRFEKVSRNDAYRLIYTEGTYVMAESTIQPFVEDFEKYRLSTVGEGKVCDICRDVAQETFDISDRQPGVNFPPLHPWCRCTFTIEVDDWDAWMEDYERRHGNGQAEKVANRLGGDLMKISIPNDVYKKSGMERQTKEKIEQAIKKLESEYTIYIDGIEGGKMGRKDIFGSGGYIDKDGILKFALLFNYDIDYQRVEHRMKYLYNKGEMAGKTFEDYIAHEIAHILPFQNCITEEDYRRTREELRNSFIAGVSGYADRTQNGAESLAEAFVRYRNGEVIPDEAEKLIRKYIYPWRK